MNLVVLPSDKEGEKIQAFQEHFNGRTLEMKIWSLAEANLCRYEGTAHLWALMYLFYIKIIWDQVFYLFNPC